MRTLALCAAALLMAGCASNGTTTVTTTQTVTATATFQQTPTMTFSKSSNTQGPGGTLTVVAVQGAPSDGLWWSDFHIQDASGREYCAKPSGRVDVRDQITCETDGPHTIVHVPTNALIYTAEF